MRRRRFYFQNTYRIILKIIRKAEKSGITIKELSFDELPKFNNKFTDLQSIEAGHKFIFRFIPRNNSKFDCRVSIKEANNVLVSLDYEIDSENL